MVDIAKDNILTHSVLNFLRASFVGQLVFHKALTSMNSKLVDDSYVEGAHRALDKIDPWLKEVFDGMPIISASWVAPETFEAIRAFGFIKEIKQDLIWLSGQVETAISLPDLTREQEAIRILVATLLRVANVRVNYLNGAGSFYAKNKDQERVALLAPQFDDARQYAQVTNVIYDTFNREGPFETELVERLRREAELCPGDLRAQAFDALSLQNAFVKNFDYEHTELPANVYAEWKAKEIPASAAGYWYAYKFTPEETAEWAQTGLTNASLAANWKRSGFEPTKAYSWQEAGFAPAVARLWMEAGYDPQRAATFASRGVQTPDKVVEEKDPAVME